MVGCAVACNSENEWGITIDMFWRLELMLLSEEGKETEYISCLHTAPIMLILHSLQFIYWSCVHTEELHMANRVLA